MKKILIIFILSFILASCQAANDAFSLKKKNTTDEFLVEKKNPLVMPPEYGDLPVPNDFENQSTNVENDEFEKIIIKSKKNSTKKKIKKTNIEQSVLEKID